MAPAVHQVGTAQTVVLVVPVGREVVKGPTEHLALEEQRPLARRELCTREAPSSSSS